VIAILARGNTIMFASRFALPQDILAQPHRYSAGQVQDAIEKAKTHDNPTLLALVPKAEAFLAEGRSPVDHESAPDATAALMPGPRLGAGAPRQNDAQSREASGKPIDLPFAQVPDAAQDYPKVLDEPIRVGKSSDSRVAFSICTLVTRPEQYKTLVHSFTSHGFSYKDCEYIYIDNSNETQYDAYRGINKFLTMATGRYIIICHQDVLLLDEGRQKLDAVLSELDRVDPNWGVCGNAGGVYPGRLAIRITDPHGENQFTEPLPRRVSGLDENFLVVRRDANLAVSADLKGFHLYGTDLCIVAHLLGYTAYVVDFHLHHLSKGDKAQRVTVKNDPNFANFAELRSALIAKYRRAMRPRIATTTTTAVYLGRSMAPSSVLNALLATSMPKRLDRLPRMLGLRRERTKGREKSFGLP
jgi:hypothetical protein